MRWFKGLLFVLIATVSLCVILLWPHPKVSTGYSAIGGYKKGRASQHGIPFVWLTIDKGVAAGTADPSYTSKEYDNKQIEVSKLLLNLIIWGALMFGVELLLRGYYRKRNQ